MSICIYCREPLPVSVPAEHVIPQSFGKFHSNFTLHCVCSQCNGFFGSRLEWALQHNSVEGILRLQHELGSGSIGSGRSVVFRVSDPGPWEGAFFRIKSKGKTKPQTIPLTQLGARRNSTEHIQWYRLTEITPKLALKYPKGSQSEFQVVGSSKKELDAVVKKMNAAGIAFIQKGRMTPPIDPNGTVGGSFESAFSDQISRCIAKVAFNYLAFVHGAAFVLSTEFDSVRAYIRYGQKPAVTIVRPHTKGLLLEERLGGSATDGHILQIDWSPDNRSVVANVSLFNSLRYVVVLCNLYDGLWFSSFPRGHHFNLHTRAIEPLSITKLHIP
jgi:hypothetical protein